MGAPPILRHVNGGMESIRTVVIGEEGRGTEKWRREYKLGGANISDWPLPDDILKRGSGWYFVRLYDAKQDLIDSLDFRYIPHLRTINVKLPQLRQSADEVGVSIEFVHGGGVSVASVGSLTDCVSSVVGAQGSQDSYRTTIFEWPFNPKIREASFEIVDGGKPVHVTFETDRIWWALFRSSQRDTEVQWESSSVEVPAEFFAPESDVGIHVRFPQSRAVEAYVGFEHATRRAIGRADKDGLVFFQLHEFSEAQELNTLGAHTLSLWVREDGQESRLDISRVTIAKTCRWCDLRTANPRDFLSHVLQVHHDEVFERLELRDDEIVGPALPSAVFICMECGQAYPRDLRIDRNATTLMLRHFDAVHPSSHPQFKRVDQPQALQNLFAQQKKLIWKCKIENCDPVVPSSDDEHAMSDKEAHLRGEHFDQLFRADL